jgi:hypothetical protein
LPLALASFAAFGLVLEILVVEEVLFSRCENKFGSALRALQIPILELRHNPNLVSSNGLWNGQVETCPPVLFDFPARLFPVALAGQRTLDPRFLSRLQIEGVSLDLLDNVLLLDLSLEAPKSVFERFTILQLYFSQIKLHLPTRPRFSALRREGIDIIKWLAEKVKPNLAGNAPPSGQPGAQPLLFQ